MKKTDLKVLEFTGETVNPLSSEKILKAALEAKVPIEDCLIIGLDEHGEFYFASTQADTGFVLHMLETGKRVIYDSFQATIDESYEVEE